jgi:hypothetical protein
MTWNHRVFKNDSQFDVYDIREVFYDENGKPDGYTMEPVYPAGNTIGELREELERMLKALKRPVLSEADFEPSSGDEGADN